MDFPDHVLFNVNVAVVAMVFRKKYGLEEPIIKSTEMWEITDKLHDTLLECLKTEDSILNFTNWFFDGIRKTFEPQNNLTSKSSSSFSLQYQHQLLVYPGTCFQCKSPYDSTPQDKWCNSCESFIFESNFHTWTSGNVELDRFIKHTQLSATDSTHFLRWIPFSAFTDLKEIGKGGFSEVYTGKYTKDRLDGTLKQWVTNMEHQVILNYMQEGDKKENIEGISLENWEKILLEFIKNMRNLYYEGKGLKCKSRVSSEEKTEKPEKTERSIKRSNSFTRLKSLLRRNSSKKRSINRSLGNFESFEAKTKVSQVPATVSPIRNKFAPKTVVLRRLVDSQNLSSSFVNELKSQYLSLRKSSKVPVIYGLTQDPQTKDYFIVEQYANCLDLHQYLIQNCASIDWWQRISILNEIVRGIYDLHKVGLVHHNLHTGNILVRHSTRRKEIEKVNSSPSVKIWISDSGLWGPAGSTESSNLTSSAASTDKNSSTTPSQSEINLRKGTYGVLPYVAPEVLQGKEYTASSDIYSLGIIMWELSNSSTLKRKQRHRQPFHDQPYDINLAKDIVTNQKRPDIYDQTAIPECWLDLMKKCWASDPEDRPDIGTIVESTNGWNMGKRKSLESKSSLVYSLSQSIISGNSNNLNPDHEGVTAQFLEAEKRRVERLNKGKQVERDDKLNSEEKKNEENKEDGTIETVDQEDEDDDVHPEASMKSRLIDFVVQASSNNDENSEITHVDSNSLKEHHVKKVDSGYQQRKEEEQEDESKQIKDETESEPEHEPEKTVEKETGSKKQHVVNEVIEPVLVQEDKTKHAKIDENPIEVKQDNKQDNQDIPIKNGIEANSETGSKEITITKEKEP